MYRLRTLASGIHALGFVAVLQTLALAVPVNWRYDCYDPRATVPRLTFPQCRSAITTFLETHTDQQYVLVKQHPQNEDELECPFHVLSSDCALEIDFVRDTYQHPTSVSVRKDDIDKFGNILARKCTRVHTGNDGGELFGFDDSHKVMLRLLHSSDIDPGPLLGSFTLQNSTEKL